LGDEFRMESMALRNSGAFGTETKGGGDASRLHLREISLVTP
jgi:hypothetical protein